MSESGSTEDGYHHQATSPTGFFDYRSLAAFRILFGATLLWNLYMRSSHGRIDALYSEFGVLPLSLLPQSDRWSFLDAFSGHISVRVGFCLIGLVYVAYASGFLIRYTKWIVFVCLLSLYHRNPLLDDGSDWTMRLFALWTAFLPLGRVWSVDSRLFRAQSWVRESDSRVATIGICCNLSVSYFLNVIQKTGDAWRTGDALRRVLWDTWVITPVSVAVRDSSLCSTFGIFSYSALALETLLAISTVLALRSLWARRIACLGIIVLHGSFGLMLYLGTFVPLYLAVAILFVPSQDWARVCRPIAGGVPRSGRKWLAETGAAVMLLWCLHQTLVTNPAVPRSVGEFVRFHTPAAAARLSRFLMIPQEWYLFPAPSAVVSTVLVSALSPEGLRVDPIRQTRFDPPEVFLGSSYAGKYWITYLIRLLREGNHRYRAQFAEYLFRQGFDEVEVLEGTMPIPQSCGGLPGEISLKRIFRASRPRIVDITTAHVAPGSTQIKRVLNQAMARFGPDWSGDSQLFAEFAPDSPTLVLEFESALECLATVALSVTHAPDYGAFDVSINSGPLVPLDLYSSFGIERHVHEMPRTKLVKGTNSLRVVLRSDSATSRARFGLDEVRLNCSQ